MNPFDGYAILSRLNLNPKKKVPKKNLRVPWTWIIHRLS